jgi:hypothetical protein
MDGSLVSGKKIGITPLNYDNSQGSMALSQDQRGPSRQDDARGNPTQNSFTEGSKNTMPNSRRDNYLNNLLSNSVGSRT